MYVLYINNHFIMIINRCGFYTYYLLKNNKYEPFEYVYHSIYISSHNYKLLNYMFSSVTILLLVIDILVHMTDTQYPTKVAMIHISINFDTHY